MEVLQEEQIGERRVRLLRQRNGKHVVAIDVLTDDDWVGFVADYHLPRREARRRYLRRLDEEKRRSRALTDQPIAQ